MNFSYGDGPTCDKSMEDVGCIAICGGDAFRLVIWEEDGKLHILPCESVVLLPPEGQE